MALHPQDSLTFYLAGRNYPDVLYRTTDGGQTWETILSEPNADYPVLGVSIDRYDPEPLYVSWGEPFSSFPGMGASWGYLDGSNMNRVSTDFTTMAVSPNDHNLIFLDGVGGMVKSVDGGMNFTLINQGLRSLKLRCLEVNPYNPDEVHALSFRGYGMYKTIDGGKSWFRSRWSHVYFCSMLIDIAQSDPNTIFVTGGGAFRSKNGGSDWEWLNNQFNHSHAHGVVIDPFDENII